MIMPLNGWFEGDFLRLVIITMPDLTVQSLLDQYPTWVLGLRIPDNGGEFQVYNEAGEFLDPAQTIEEAGLGYSDLFTIRQVAPAA